jgi:hypothetical protein
MSPSKNPAIPAPRGQICDVCAKFRAFGSRLHDERRYGMEWNPSRQVQCEKRSFRLYGWYLIDAVCRRRRQKLRNVVAAMGGISVAVKRLKEARLRVVIAQKQLGIKAGTDDFSASARITQYERGKHMPGGGA